jgi:predicted dienelactone hydrolase
VTRFWQRTEDVSFVIDSLDTVLPEHLTMANANIVVMVHSSGGHTAAALAGVTMDIKQMYDYCASHHAKADLGCRYGERETPKQAKHLAQKIPRGLDDRVTGIIMLDPAMGTASTKASMNSVKVPTLIIGSQNNDFLPFKYHAKYYAGNFPNAKLVALNTGEGHFVYINSCDNSYKARWVSLCQDSEGVNRNEVHQKMLGHILMFVSNNS